LPDSSSAAKRVDWDDVAVESTVVVPPSSESTAAPMPTAAAPPRSPATTRAPPRVHEPESIAFL
jgi:hypothetical protein